MDICKIIAKYAAPAEYKQSLAAPFCVNNEASNEFKDFKPLVAKVSPRGQVWASDRKHLCILELDETALTFRVIRQLVKQPLLRECLQLAFDLEAGVAFAFQAAINNVKVFSLDNGDLWGEFTANPAFKYQPTIAVDHTGCVLLLGQEQRSCTEPTVLVYTREGKLVRTWQVIPVIDHTYAGIVPVERGSIAVNRAGDVCVLVKETWGWQAPRRRLQVCALL